MNNYAELKNKEQELREQYNKLANERRNIIGPVYRVATEHPDLIPEQVLSKNFENIEIHRLERRITVAIENIESSELSESEKSSIIEELSKSQRDIEENVRNADKILDEERKVALEKSQRAVELQETYDKLNELKKEIEMIDQQIKTYEGIKNQMQQDGINSKAIEGVTEEINDLKNRRQQCVDKINLIISEPGIEEELEAFIEDKDIENKKLEEAKAKAEAEAKEEEKRKRVEELREKMARERAKKELEEEQEQEKVDFVVEEVPEGKKDGETVSEKKEEPKEKDPIEPVKPEKLKRPIGKHKASPELIARIKKFAKPAIGLTLIGLAVSAVIANPLLIANVLGAAMGGGLVFDELKNSVKK